MKTRLDILVHERGLAASRELARRYIMAGEVRVGGQVMDKPGVQVSTDAEVELLGAARFVSRGGDKLEGAFQVFDLDVEGKICADVGACTGGFTDCLLQHGAAKVYAIDVGYGQLAMKLQQDPRVVVMERTNARYVEKLDIPVSFVTIDASFISLKILLPVIKNWLTPEAHIIALIKPQFEAGKSDVGKGGVVKDTNVHRRVLEEVLGFAQQSGFTVRGVAVSPLTGPKGNVEFLGWLSVGEAAEAFDLETAIKTVAETPT
ncbi:MAG: TlyA family RNA methyltransferase [Anaerolineae bacterium]|nr:TlyA family RNA methyltransferase [Anaerolineae bacterium]